MPEKLIIRDRATLEQYRGSCGPAHVDFENGEFAVDAIGLATAEELLRAFRPALPEVLTQMVVGILLEAGLTYDSTLDGEIE